MARAVLLVILKKAESTGLHDRLHLKSFLGPAFNPNHSNLRANRKTIFVFLLTRFLLPAPRVSKYNLLYEGSRSYPVYL